MELSDYLAAAIAKQELHSDSKLADALGINRANLTRYRKGYGLPDDDTMLLLAKLAGMDQRAALLDLNCWRSKGRARTLYTAMRQGLTAACIIAGVVAGNSSMSSPAHASTTVDSPGSIYIMRQFPWGSWTCGHGRSVQNRLFQIKPF